MEARSTLYAHHTDVKTPIILRLEDNLSSENLPPEFKQSICQSLGITHFNDAVRIENISSDDDLAKHYIARINALHDGILFLLNCSDLYTYKYPEQLITHLEKLKNDCVQHIDQLTNKHIGILQASLYRYVQVITSELEMSLGLTHDDALQQLELAESFALALNPKPAVCTIITINHDGKNHLAALIDKPENPFTHPELIEELTTIQTLQWPIKDIAGLPEWFTSLKPFQQIEIMHFLKQIPHLSVDLGTNVNALSSRMRLIPAPSNYASHVILTYIQKNDEAPRLTRSTPILRSAHSASRDVSEKSEEIRATHTNRNIECQLNTIREMASQLPKSLEMVIPILYQTLITPFKEPDKTLENDRLAAIPSTKRNLDNFSPKNLKFDIFNTNHPLNYGKYISFTTAGSYNGNEVKSMLKFIATNKESMSPLHNPLLLDISQELLDKALNSHQYLSSYRELYLAALEQLVDQAAGGYTLGGCVSGKDRKAILTSLVDAMLVYFELIQTLPPMQAETPEEIQALKLLADLFSKIFFKSKHPQFLAAQNAPGAFGTKTPGMYLPSFLIEGIQRSLDTQHHPSNADTLLKESDRLASNNDLRHITPLNLPDHLQALVWQPPKNNHVANIQNIGSIMPDIIAIIENRYLRTRDEHIRFISRLSHDTERGKYRAYACAALLKDNALSTAHRLLILCGLFCSEDSKYLRQIVAETMGFPRRTPAKLAIIKCAQVYFPDFKSVEPIIEFISKKINSINNSLELGTAVHMIRETLTTNTLLTQTTGSSRTNAMMLTQT